MRVLIFTDADVFAGTERHILDLAEGLRQEGVDVCIACPTPAPLAERAQAAGIEVVPIQKGGHLDRAAIGMLSNLLASGKIQIVHAHNGRTFFSGALAVRRAGKGVCVATQHFLEPHHATRRGPGGLLFHAAHWWTNGHIAHFIAISQAVKQAMLARHEAPEAKITVVPNGIADPTLLLLPSSPIRQQLDIPNDTPLVVCVARLEPEKDISTLIAAMKQVAAVHAGAYCAIAGQGSQQAHLQQEIQRHGLQDRVRLLGFRQDALTLIHAGDIFVLPSLAEPFGLVLLEAMALRKPVIATRAGGPLEIVEEGRTGLLVPPADPQALAQAILQMITNPQAAQAMGNAGRERFERYFTARQMAQATLAVYEKAVKSEGGE